MSKELAAQVLRESLNNKTWGNLRTDDILNAMQEYADTLLKHREEREKEIAIYYSKWFIKQYTREQRDNKILYYDGKDMITITHEELFNIFTLSPEYKSIIKKYENK